MINRHAEDVVDGLASVVHIQHILLEALAVALLAFERDIRHELHFDGDGPLAFAYLAPPSGGVEREMCGGESHLSAQRLVGVQLAYLIVGFQVGYRVGARGLAERVLVDKLDV